jgi:hypothetical protein
MVDLAGIVPDITALALDDKNNEIWAPAIQLLIALSASSSCESTNELRAFYDQVGTENEP